MSLIPFAGAVQKFNRQRGGYQIERSLRFNSADSAYLSRTQGSGSRTTWTYSFWAKFFTQSGEPGVFTFNNTSNVMYFNGTTNGALLWYDGNGSSFYLVTTQLFRDFSAWYHIVAVADTTNGTQGDRIRLYVNGTRVTAFAIANYPSSSGYVTGANQSGTTATISRSTYSLNGYMTEVNFIDGQALDPTSFGEYNTDTGVWQPKAYSGSYGTNGFYLNFSDNSDVTAATLGADSSGNGNNWTPNNFSVTAGADNDSLVDTPTDYGEDTGAGGEVRGNYATLNPLMGRATVATQATVSNGNLTSTHTPTAYGSYVWGSIAASTGKFYFEVTATSFSGGSGIGIDTGVAQFSSDYNYVVWYQNNGTKYANNTASSYGASYTTGDIIGVAYDLDAGTVTFYKNGASQGVAATGLSGYSYLPMLAGEAGAVFNWNFGQRPFAHAAPSGFKALCTQNLPEPTIVDGGEYFNTVLYTGNGSTQSITGVGFQPDFVWIKGRSHVTNNRLSDAVRGVNKSLITNSTNAEDTSSSYCVTSFNSDGFSLTSGAGDVNQSGETHVAWNWKANGASVSNTDGTITSTVSANTDSGFSIVTYTGTNVTGATVGHGLGTTPSMIIIKQRDVLRSWFVYHISIGNTGYIQLHLTDAEDKPNSTVWNNSGPSSTTFTIGSSSGVNESGGTYVAYCFAAIPGYSAFGSYTGNGSTDGSFVYLGFRPRFVMVKRTNDTGSWRMFDNARSPENVVARYLYANLTNAEDTGAVLDFVSNGFKFRNDSTDNNASGSTYIYMAFAENPFKYSLAR
jgi:hypothetical protein